MLKFYGATEYGSEPPCRGRVRLANRSMSPRPTSRATVEVTARPEHRGSSRARKSRARSLCCAIINTLNYNQFAAAASRADDASRESIVSVPTSYAASVNRTASVSERRHVGAKLEDTPRDRPRLRARVYTPLAWRDVWYTIAGGIIPKTTKTPKAPALSSACRKTSGRVNAKTTGGASAAIHGRASDESTSIPSAMKSASPHRSRETTSTRRRIQNLARAPPWRRRRLERGDGIAHRRRVRGHAPEHRGVPKDEHQRWNRGAHEHGRRRALLVALQRRRHHGITW